MSKLISSFYGEARESITEAIALLQVYDKEKKAAYAENEIGPSYAIVSSAIAIIRPSLVSVGMWNADLDNNALGAEYKISVLNDILDFVTKAEETMRNV